MQISSERLHLCYKLMVHSVHTSLNITSASLTVAPPKWTIVSIPITMAHNLNLIPRTTIATSLLPLHSTSMASIALTTYYSLHSILLPLPESLSLLSSLCPRGLTIPFPPPWHSPLVITINVSLFFWQDNYWHSTPLDHFLEHIHLWCGLFVCIDSKSFQALGSLQSLTMCKLWHWKHCPCSLFDISPTHFN